MLWKLADFYCRGVLDDHLTMNEKFGCYTPTNALSI